VVACDSVRGMHASDHGIDAPDDEARPDPSPPDDEARPDPSPRGDDEGNSRLDLDLDVATLRAELDLRWPDATGDRRAGTDESHRLVLCHPEYDGFVTLLVTARTDLDGVLLLPEPALDRVMTAHHRTARLQRGEQLPIDLELHPGNVEHPASDGTIRIVDPDGEDVAAPVRLTVATHRSLECVLAGACDGPLEPAELQAAADQLRAGATNVRALARRIDRARDTGADPGPGRTFPSLRWGRR
jgi:hypothetical protein